MAVITFSKPVSFPIAPLRDMLAKYLPLYRWQCGDDDTGAAQQMGSFRDHGIISGRSDGTVIFTEYRARLSQFPGAPAHEWYLELFAPTTELQPIAERITAVICAVTMILDEHDAHCQLIPGGPWLSAQAMPGILRALANGATLADAVAVAGPGAPPAAPPIPLAPRATLDIACDGKRVLPHLAVLLDRPLRYEGDVLAGFVNELDPDGGWAFHRSDSGQGVLVGRGALIGIIDIPQPLPDGMVSDGWTRSFWFQGDRARVQRHSSHICITTALDTAAADWVTVRQVAKVMTLAAAWIARLPGAVALHNTGPGITFEASQASNFLAILARDQLPVMLWSWTKPHDMADGNVCLSTSGLVPFLGHEMEVWNAPLPVAEVQTQLSDIIIYLLDAGPVIGHGDTAGRTKGDRSIRCFLGPSRAERPEAVQALFLEFEGQEAATPKPDLPETAKPPMSSGSEGVLRDFVAKMAGRDDTGMSDVIRGMLAENEAAKSVSRAAQAPLDPKLAETDRLLAQLKHDADGTSAEAIEAMQEMLRNAPPRDVIESDANPFHVNLMKMIGHEQATGALPTPDTTLPSGHVATLLLHSGVGLPARDLLEQLGLAFPERRWSVSASNQGLNVPRTVTGAGGDGTITARIVAHPDACPEAGTPRHIGHIVVSIASPDADDARFVATLICACLVVGQDRRAQARLAPGEGWLDYEDIIGRMVAVKHQRRVAPTPVPQATAGFGRRVGGFGRKGL